MGFGPLGVSDSPQTYRWGGGIALVLFPPPLSISLNFPAPGDGRVTDTVLFPPPVLLGGGGKSTGAIPPTPPVGNLQNAVILMVFLLFD